MASVIISVSASALIVGSGVGSLVTASALASLLEEEHEIPDNFNPDQIDPYWWMDLERQPKPSEDEIRTSYRRCCLKYHPDKNRHCPEKASFKLNLTTKCFEYVMKDCGYNL